MLMMIIAIVAITMTTCIYSSSMAGSLVVGRANSVNQTFFPHLEAVVMTVVAVVMTIMVVVMTIMVVVMTMVIMTSDKWC